MLALGQALMKNPRLLLLDEPSTGLGPKVINEVGKVLQGVRSEGMTVVLVEQNCTLAFQEADQIYVLEQGEIGSREPLLKCRVTLMSAKLTLEYEGPTSFF